MKKPDQYKALDKAQSRGSVLFAVFGAVVLVGIIGASVTSFVKGPLTSAVRQTKTNAAKTQMQIAAQVAVMASTTGRLNVNERVNVFETSSAYSPILGGLSGADAICQSDANAAGLTGTYKAWLSDSTQSPSTRFNKLNVPYKLTDNTTIANNWTDLTDGTLAAIINKNADGTAGLNWGVRTNTKSDGTIYSTVNTCSDYTATGANPFRAGTRASTTAWTDGGDLFCNNGMVLYCFGQQAVTNNATNGDCDGDGTVEPLEFKAAGTTPAPTGGGLLPSTVGVNRIDPWGTQYGYCSWDYGTTTLASSCQQSTPGTTLRLAGHATNQTTPVVAIISAGPDRKFTTTCRSFATADANSNGSLNDSGDLALVGKTNANDDDIIFAYNYTQAASATGGLWSLKSSDATTALVNKKIEALGATFTGAGYFSQLAAAVGADFVDIVSGLRLGSPTTVSTCDSTNVYAMRRNASSNALEMCNGSSWVTAAAAASTSGLTGTTATMTDAKVFITSQFYTGDLGGLSGADNECQRLATAAGLPGTFKAWLSDGTNSASARFVQASVPYKLVDGTIIANNWADLIDGTLANGINKSQNNTGVAAVQIWTGTQSDGTSSAANCLNWSTSASTSSGRIGHPSDTTSGWSVLGNATCDGARPLFCFQQTGAITGGGGGGTSAGSIDTMSDANYDSLKDNLFIGAGTSTGTGASMGGNNTAFGISSMAGSLISGGSNAAFGYQAMNAMTAGSWNTAFGYKALYSNNSIHNTAFGYQALMNATTQQYNTAVGYQALTGSGFIGASVVVGANAGNQGSNNTAVGSAALDSVTGSNNSAAGYNALGALVAGNRNTAMGTNAAAAISANSDSVAVGNGALFANTMQENLAAGYYAGATDGGTAIVAVGTEALRYNSGNYNTAIGYQALMGPVGGASGAQNTAVGYQSMKNLTIGVSNTGVGYLALALVQNGSNNTAVGSNALGSVISGSSNTAVGSNALATTTGDYNTAVGAEALRYLSSSQGYNTALGYMAGRSITTAKYNVAVGMFAQYTDLASAIYTSTAVGYNALFANRGVDNTAIGYQSMASNVSGTDNTAVGQSALRQNTIGSYNVAVGDSAMYNSTGSNNVAVGVFASKTVLGDSNVGIGHFAGFVGGTSARNVYVGAQAGGSSQASTMYDNTALGQQALRNNSTGQNITAVGYQALNANTTGTFNTAGGFQSLLVNIDGSYNTTFGYNSLSANISGWGNTAVGVDALAASNSTTKVDADCSSYSATYTNDPLTGHCYFKSGGGALWNSAQTACKAVGGYLAVISSATEQAIVKSVNGGASSFIGIKDTIGTGVYSWQGGELDGVQFWQGNSSGAATYNLYSNWTSGNPSILAGCAHMDATTGTWSVSSGATCGNSLLYICEKDPTMQSSYNTAIGRQAMLVSTTGSDNVALGQNALDQATIGSGNVAVGYQAMHNITTGSNNTAIGYGAGPTTGALTNTTALGYNATVSASNTIRLGDTNITTIAGQVAFTATSDKRVKKDIKPSDLGLEFIMKLKPVSYRLKNGNGRIDYGFLAQDIEEALDGRITNMITRRNDEMKTYQLRSSDLLAPLAKAIAEQDETIRRLREKIATLKEQRKLQARACTVEDPT